MIKLSPRLSSALKLILIALLTIPIYGYFTFYWMYPVICPIPLGSLYLYMLYGFLIAFSVGMVVDSMEYGFVILVIGSLGGYILAIFYQGFPALLYGYGIYLSDLMILQFIETTWILLIMYVIMGLPGLFLGVFAQENVRESDDV
ncbi:MAG: hypothetical protein GXO25_06185 [Euryarchaeota archaeon]|nr:hypothetical protein [Euryarchaeota archaeon]